MLTVRGPDAPTPCSTRPSSNTEKLSAITDTKQPMRNSDSPATMTGLRPKASDSGPNNNWPKALPSRKRPITSWASFGSLTARSAPIWGRAGSIASMESATRLVSSAMSDANSATLMRSREGLIVFNALRASQRPATAAVMK